MFVYVGGNSTTSPCLTEEPATDRYFKVGIIKIFMYVEYMYGNIIKSSYSLIICCITASVISFFTTIGYRLGPPTIRKGRPNRPTASTTRP